MVKSAFKKACHPERSEGSHGQVHGIATAGRAGLAMTAGRLFLLALLINAFLSPLPAQQKAVFILGDLTVRAWTLDKNEERIVAEGEVEIIYKQIKLFADRIELDTKTKDVLAIGHITLQMPEEVVDCEKLSFNLDTQQGKLDKALGRIQPSVMYEAASIERKADNLYNLEKASITSCTQPTPRWKFSFSKAEFKKDDYVAMRNAVLSIKKVPIYYWPYIRYPLDQQQRATGFLMPKIGYSGVKGFTLSQGFYWAIARNMDASFSLDYYGAKGVGGGMEYRYLFSGTTGGDVQLYYFTFKTPAAETSSSGKIIQPVKPEDAYIVRWEHNQTLPLGFSLVASVDYQSSFEFLREFDNNFMRALIYNRYSQVYLSKSWSSFSFNARTARIETSFPAANTTYINTYYPQIGFDSFKIKILSPLYFSFSSSYSNWQFGSRTQFLNKRQIKNRELSFTPALSLPFNSIRWLSVNLSWEAFFNYYWRSLKEGGVVEDPILARYYAFNIDLIGPVFYRIWEAEKEVEKDQSNATRLKHVFEPTLSYRFESPIINGERVVRAYPAYRYHQISFGFVNHLLIKKGGAPKEIFTWGVVQNYYLEPKESPNKNYPINGVIPRFSEVDSYIRLFPRSGLSFDIAASFNTYFRQFSTIRMAANLGSPADNLFLIVNLYNSIYVYKKDPRYNRQQIGLYTGFKIPNLSLEVEGEMDYNITEKKILYMASKLFYHYQCLDLKADVRFFFFREKFDMQFSLSVGLGNIGKTTDFLGGARFN